MKKRNLLVGIVAVSLLSGCSFIEKLFSSSKNKEPIEEIEDNSQPRDDVTEEKKKIGEFYGGVVNDGKFVGYEFSSVTSSRG